MSAAIFAGWSACRWALRRVPPALWLALLGAALIALGVQRHRAAVRGIEEKAFARGVREERRRAEAAASRGAARFAAREALLARQSREKQDADNRRAHALAADLGLRGPGRAAAGRCVGDGRAAAGRPHAAGRAVDAGMAAMPEPRGAAFAQLPWEQLVARAGACDLDRAEVIAWRGWWAARAGTGSGEAAPGEGRLP